MISAGIIVTDPEFRKQIVAHLKGMGVRVEFAVEGIAGQAHQTASTNPDLLVLDFSQPGMPGVMAEIRSMEAPVAVIAVHHLGEAEAILTALRLGAREFLWPPRKEKALASAVRTIEAQKTQRDARRQAATVVGFLAAAGGCGATTIACHVAADLRRSGAGQVGLLDFDLAAGTAGFWFGAAGSNYSVLDAVHNLGRMDTSLWKGLVSAVQPQLDVLAAPAEIPLGGLPGARDFAGVLSYARCQYDWIVADLGSNLTAVSVALIEGLNVLYLVTTPEVSSLLQTRRIVQKLIQLDYPKEKMKVLVSRVQKGQIVYPDDLKNMIGLPVEAVFPSDNQETAEAHASGRLMAPKSDYGKRIAQLSATLTGKTLEEPKPSRFSMFRLRSQEA
jgi:pilus assembly protein CpaE